MRRAPLTLLLVLTACSDLGGYATASGEVYRGTVVGVEDPPVLRRGFASMAVLSMSFDPTRATSLSEPPGRLTTSDGALTDVALVPIVPLTHDALSEYEIPQGARVRNYIFLMQPEDGPLAGREPMVFLSLMADGSLEARIIAGGGSGPDDYFGFWRLTREPE
ncbi:MAG: hypothetical protein KC619_05330 [Myxococcales bacterium]|nr:hypothetical protein [Myxococcales bacterium]